MAGIITFATLAFIGCAILLWFKTKSGKKWLEQL